MTLDDYAAIIAILNSAYPHHLMPESTVALWRARFGALDARVFFDAVGESIDTNDSGFPPTIGEIQKILTDQRERARYSALPPARSDEAKGWVRHAPWFIELQIARWRNHETTKNLPLDELRELGVEHCLGECKRFEVMVGDPPHEVTASDVEHTAKSQGIRMTHQETLAERP